MGIATLMVMIHHITWKSSTGVVSYIYMFVRHLGAGGVDIFLFLSGFGLHYSFKKSKRIFEFYKNRFLRIIPTYFLIAAPWYFYFDVLKDDNWLLFGGDLSTISFLFCGDRGHWYIFGIIVLYLFYPLWNKCLNRKFTMTICTFIMVWLVVVVGIASVDEELFSRINVFLMRIPVFFIGTVTGELSNRTFEINRTQFRVLNSLLFVTAIMSEGWLCINGMQYSAAARLLYTPMALGICYIGTSIESLKNLYRVLKWIGGISLEVYLIHMKCTHILTKILEDQNLAFVNMLSIVISITLGYLAGLIVRQSVYLKTRGKLLVKSSKNHGFGA